MPDVRVRFAPSPTGRLHIGGARTALFNYLFARHVGGSFILRIEDTDIERSSVELEQRLLEDIGWLGLAWDEGPGGEGEYGPYRQSERIGIYRELAGKLVEDRKAYPCFCSEEDLERKREQAKAKGRPPRYDGTCRNLSDGQVEEKRKAGLPGSIRFLVPEGGGPASVEDLARGTVEFPPDMVGDFVILRSNGMPTYNFAAAVDDAGMRITHVIRGAEHLSNTVRQLLVYEALDIAAPSFAHIPLILGSDRTKLSKRHGAPNVGDYRNRGYPSEAIVNYLAFLGWSTKGASEILSFEELIAEFELARVSDSPSIFDEDKLNWISAGHIRKGGSDRYFDQALPFFPDAMRERYGREELVKIFDIASENLPCFEKLPLEAASFMPGPPAFDENALTAISGSNELLIALEDKLSSISDWHGDAVRAAIKDAGKKSGKKGKELYMPLRIAVTGMAHGPDLSSILVVRGRDDVNNSIAAARERINMQGGR
jgi:nondiscriminating glutamyl-tRNA synthetase